MLDPAAVEMQGLVRAQTDLLNSDAPESERIEIYHKIIALQKKRRERT